MPYNTLIHTRPQMTFNNDIERTKKEIEILTKKLSFLEELERTKTPCEEAYRRWWGEYPKDDDDDGWEIVSRRWRAFQKGYDAAQKDYKVGEYQEPVEEPEELKTLYDKLETWIEYGNFAQSKDVLVNEILNIVKEFIPEPMVCDDEDFDAGYNEAIRIIKTKLQ